jgi:antitoxin (DNA-binding transcriptional repressor) of toxin-antitoxin stability system
MKTITVRDLRQRWPDAEALLEREHELIVTRDGKPVARLVRFREPTTRRRRFDAKQHAKWQKAMSGGRTVQWVDEFLIAERNER